jgi:flavodoxin
MKKNILLYVFTLLISFTLTGCGIKNDNINSDTSSEIRNNNKSVVLYFSATGTTKTIAERIALKSNSDIIEIIPKEKYSNEDLNYNSDCRANREQNNAKARPEIANTIDVGKYDIIYLGYPIWWGTNPKIILTLLDKYDFTDKTIIPFCTSGSTGISGSVRDLRKYNTKLTIKDGKRFTLSDSDKEIEDFISNN